MNLLINEWRKFLHRWGVVLPFPALQLVINICYFAVIRFSLTPSSWHLKSYYSISLNLAIAFTMFLGIILAATTLTQELASGTIKFLLTRPYDRHKILLAKFAAIVLLVTGFALVAMVIAYLLELSFLGAVPQLAFVCQQAGIACLNLLSGIIFFGAFALMVSCLVNSSALSTAITLIFYTSGPLIWSLITSMFLKIAPDSWLYKLSPFNVNNYLTSLFRSPEFSFNSEFWLVLLTNLLDAAIFYFIADFIFKQKNISLAS